MILSCNLNSYRKFRPKEGDTRAYEHLQSIGVKFVEIRVPAAGEVERVKSELAKFDLAAKTLIAKCDLSDANAADNFAWQAEVAQTMSVQLLFVSAKAGDMPKTVAYGRLREVGDVCAQHGVTICVETHPDLAHSGDEALQTMRGVNHPNVRINFDTANIYYYNEVPPGMLRAYAIAELEKIKPFIAAIHLKDTNGGFKTWNFPPLGRGIVDFAGVFKVLNDVGFYGPFTMELEGIEGEELDFDLTCASVAESVNYLRKSGLVE